jgi:ASC-1-like (ASCH) protein
MVKKEAFEWIKTGQKTIELRRGKAKAGDRAIFQCGRNILKGIIISKDEGNLLALLHNFNFKEIIPAANSIEEATAYIKKLYGTIDGIFTAYRFALSR